MGTSSRKGSDANQHWVLMGRPALLWPLLQNATQRPTVGTLSREGWVLQFARPSAPGPDGRSELLVERSQASSILPRSPALHVTPGLGGTSSATSSPHPVSRLNPAHKDVAAASADNGSSLPHGGGKLGVGSPAAGAGAISDPTAGTPRAGADASGGASPSLGKRELAPSSSGGAKHPAATMVMETPSGKVGMGVGA